MKILTYYLVILTLVLSACDNDTLNSPNNDDTENLIKTETQKRGDENITIGTLISESIYIGDKEGIEKAKTIPMSEWEGPFQATASRIVGYSDLQHFVDYVPGLAATLYWCDFLVFRATTSFPAGAVAYVEEPTTVGWTDFIHGFPGVSGVTVRQTSTGNIEIETHTIHIKNNTAGQSIDIEFPQELSDGFDYTYYYIEP